ncbi:NADH-ubiquinone oxidoreductase-F iron-sulfur binding region domain-containing protein [Tundrisphaera lichenicola]|uniref:NADH-ubiquinone oxidoreductase-F iron-sulfur binding region domain-containing protein n=1 Tax=Tundrisphaera lichenicola TaxID=2029860 RepID=UPI003EB9315C
MRGDAETPLGSIHPGAGRRRAVSHPKGRQLDPSALAEIRELLGDRPRRRDLLIEHLHLIQDRFHALSPAHLAALAEEMLLPMAVVYEVATFYAHFDVLDDGQSPPPPLTVRACDGIACMLRDAGRLREGLAARLEPSTRVVHAPCMGRCEHAPAVLVGRKPVDHATVDSVVRVVEQGDFEPDWPDSKSLEDYLAGGGYQALRDCRVGLRTPEEVIDILDASGLRGLGGAGFVSARKWEMVRQAPKPRLMAINADEGEPGTFKDRVYLEADPHRFLEGMLIAAWAVEADEIYIYLRDEYPQVRRLLDRELARLKEQGLSDPPVIHLRRGAGAYICGEETAMLESIEGKRGYPRHKPPYPTQVGLFGRPTLIHNVETVYWIREILERPRGWPASEGRNGRHGLRSFSVSGRVKDPGVKLAPAGITVRELIDEYCGGMEEGHTFKAYLPGGASGGIFPARMGDVPLDFGTLEPLGGFIGSAAVVVFSEADNMRDVALNLMRFFEDESCGQCTPCRCGTEKAVALMEQPNWDQSLLAELGGVMRDASICGLGQAAPNPMLAVLRYFPEDLG